MTKEHYCYKIHTLLRKSSVYPSRSIEHPLYGLPPFSQENLTLKTKKRKFLKKGEGHNNQVRRDYDCQKLCGH